MYRWILTQFYLDSNGNMQPVCAAYGTRWVCPVLPSTVTQWALVQMAITQQGIAAAAADTRVIVLPDITDTTPVSSQVILAYAPPATGQTANVISLLQVNAQTDSGLSIAQIIHRLIAVEPAFGHVLSN